ncbi:MAG TPA: quinone oxidoreductase [Rhizobiales bacterium]|nr:quinone oxidoreductase [Hyphomicrobiales bacterium]
MSKMQRIEIAAHGGTDQMKLQERDISTLQAGQILVRHEAIGVNFIDTYHRTGLYPVPSLPSGLGGEAAGVVEAIGENVEHVKVGDRVAYCSGPIGSYATHNVIAADSAVLLPNSISSKQAAASLLKGLTVQYLIRQIYPVKAGETVLFHAAAGGVGTLAVQWLKHIGAEVIGTVGSDDKADLVRKLGCDHIINYRKDVVSEKVDQITNGAKLPVVFDGVGKDTFADSLKCLHRRGLMVSFGNASGPVDGVNLGILASHGSLFVTRPTLYDYIPTRPDLEQAANDFFVAISAGGIKIADPAEYALQDAARAHEDLQARLTTGSIILVP